MQSDPDKDLDTLMRLLINLGGLAVTGALVALVVATIVAWSD